MNKNNFIELRHTNHSNIRCQQRGIKAEVIEFIVKYGNSKNTHTHKKYFINKKILNKLKYKHDSFIRKFDKQILTTGVILKKNIVITAFKIQGNYLWN
tara:strand:+ start:224 stop:517 length:294 start_codon:yes stop_codon:yes gene_type:complete